VRYEHDLGTTDLFVAVKRLRVFADISRMKHAFCIHCFASFVAVKVNTQKKRYRRAGSLDHAGFDE
jgi:hypothetical protein